MKQAILASLLLLSSACGSCAELQPIKDTAETVVDRADDVLVKLSAAYAVLCSDEDAGPQPAFCAAAKENLNLAISARNDLVGE